MYSVTLPIHGLGHPGAVGQSEANRYGLSIRKLPGENKYMFSGSYDDLMFFMTDFFAMTDAEADIEINDSADEASDPFSPAIQPEYQQEGLQMKTPTLRQLFLTEAPFPHGGDEPYAMEPDEVEEEIPDAGFDGFEETEFEPEGPTDVAIEVLPAETEENCVAPEEDFMPFGTMSPLAGFGTEEVDEFGKVEEPITGAAAEEVEEFEEEGPTARTAGSGRAFEGLDPAKQVHENVGFDRFMDRILVQESISVQRPVLADSRQRIRAAKHQERPLGRIRYGVK